MSVRDLTPQPSAAAFTLVLLHHAGGSAGSFVPFVPHLPDDWRVVAVDLPGRLFEPAGRACRTGTEAVRHLLSALRPELSGPYAVFGHSMGALLAYELARALERRGGGPRWLGVSGCPAPHVIGVARAAGRRRVRSAWSSRLPHLARGPFADRMDERLGERIIRTLRDDLAILGRRRPAGARDVHRGLDRARRRRHRLPHLARRALLPLRTACGSLLAHRSRLPFDQRS
jgi:surfactin synthase thioesterase subunit